MKKLLWLSMISLLMQQFVQGKDMGVNCIGDENQK